MILAGMMNKPVHILLVEDQSSDAELAQSEIHQSIHTCNFQRVETAEACRKALETFRPDVILAKYNLLHLNGMQILNLAREHAPPIPVIVWTVSSDEEIAVQCIKAGAHNYVTKENIQRLGPAVLLARQERQSIPDRKLTKEKYRTTFENSPIGIFQSSPGGKFISVNPAMARIYGYDSPEDMIDTVQDISGQLYLEPGDREGFTRLFETQDLVENYELENKRKDGSVFWTDTSARAVRDEGGHILFYEGFLQDVTERKQAHEAVRQSEDRFRALIENGRDNISLLDKDGILLWESPAKVHLLGYEINTFRGHNMFELVHPEDRGWTQELFTEMFHEPEKQLSGTFRLKHADGTWRWVEATATNMLHDPNIGAIVINHHDVTDHKQAEEALQQSEERYRSLLNIAPIGIGVHVDGKLVFANAAAARIVGANSSDELLGRSVMKFVHPEEREKTLETLQGMLNGQTGLYPREERFIRTDGSIINVEVLATSMRFLDRPAVQVIVQDITERKQSEKEIKRHLAELGALYENGLALGRLLEPHEIGQQIIDTFARYLSWHHVTIRLLRQGTNDLELAAFSLPHMKEAEKQEVEQNFINRINKVGQGLCGWVVQNGKPFRTGNVQKQPQYVDIYDSIQSGLYMPLKVGNHVIGVISVESEKADAFEIQDERLLATLANQAAVAFENARLYQELQQELQERRNAEKALRHSEAHYRELADSVTDIFFELDQNMRYTHWNKASEMLTGVTADKAIGKTMRDILGSSEEQARIEAIYRSVLEHRQPRTFETAFTIHTNKSFFEVNAYPSARGVSVVAKDVTERKLLEIILQKRFELMEYAAQHSLDEVMQKIIDEVCELTDSEIGFFHFMEEDQNTLGRQMWSTKTRQLLPASVSQEQHLPADQAGVWAEALRSRRSVIHNEYDPPPTWKGYPNDHVEIVREMVIPIIRHERILAVMGVANKPQKYTQHDLAFTERIIDHAWDITERKQMEIALAEERNQLARRVDQRTAELIQVNANLARALRVKDEFLANMSHELRTPLNAILGLSESLAEQIAGPLNQKQLKYISTIGESGHHLLYLINDILDLAKIEAGQIKLDINKLDVNRVCQSSLRMVKQLAQKKNLGVFFNIDQDLGLMWADERRLKQMLVNLLSNAVKFTPKNGTIGLDVHGIQDENKVEFSVWDNGIGIDQAEIPRLFQPFVQLDSGLARENTGAGLGLALVAQMARLHGGSVGISSEPASGSRFIIMLPWEPALAVDTVERLRNTGQLKLPNQTGNSPHRKTILLVEDTEEVTTMLKEYLEAAGYDVCIAHDGAEGITQANLTRPDLILMDIQMSHMDGFETTKRLRGNAKFKNTPIIALTALTMPHDRERYIAAGMDEYISKPVDLKVLSKMLEQFLPHAEATRNNP